MCLVFFFYATETTEIYTYRHTLSLHDARPISTGFDRGMMRRSPTPAHFYCPLSPFARLPYSPFYIIYRLRIAPRSELVTSARNASNRERVMRKTLDRKSVV